MIDRGRTTKGHRSVEDCYLYLTHTNIQEPGGAPNPA